MLLEILLIVRINKLSFPIHMIFEYFSNRETIDYICKKRQLSVSSFALEETSIPQKLDRSTAISNPNLILELVIQLDLLAIIYNFG
jgi:hypothetical protein